MKNFRDLVIWQEAHRFVLAIYKVTASFPDEEKYGLQSQLRRCSTSIPSNIAEGCGRKGDKELSRFVQIAMGSASEAEYQLLLSHDLGYFGSDTYEALERDLSTLKRRMNAFLQKLT